MSRKLQLQLFFCVTFTLWTGIRFELVTSSLVKFLILSSCSLWSWSFSWSSWERTFFSVTVVCVTEETCRQVMHTSVLLSFNSQWQAKQNTSGEKKKQEWWYLPREAVAWGLRFHFDTFWAEPRHQTPLSHEGRSSSSWQCWQTNINRHWDINLLWFVSLMFTLMVHALWLHFLGWLFWMLGADSAQTFKCKAAAVCHHG